MEIFSKEPLKNALKFGKMITRLMDFFYWGYEDG